MEEKPTKPQPILLTEEQTAHLLSVTQFALRKWRRKGIGPRYIRCGARLIRYVEKDVTKWLDENSHVSNANELRAQSLVS